MEFSHVFLEVKVPAEALPTDVTGEGLLVVVGVHVEGQVVDLMEGLVTNVTFVLLLRRVCQFMVLVVALLVEALATELAHEGLVVGVNSHVGVEGGGD